MGISLSVYAITDEQIHALINQPDLADEWIRRSQLGEECYLADYWDGLHFLLTRNTPDDQLPWAALRTGDVEYPQASTTMHAILAATAQAFAGEMQSLYQFDLRERFDLQRMLDAHVYPIRLWLFPEQVESTFGELLHYFERLKRIIMQAAEEGKGLLFRRYEDL
jgi:hypothetical protein